MKFNFIALKITGEKYDGLRESQNKFTLYNELKAEGETLISAVEVHERESIFLHFHMPFLGIPEHQKIIFAKNLGYMIDAGLPLAKALSVLEKQIGNKKFKSVIRDVEEEIRKGQTLSSALAARTGVFPSLFIAMVKAGEESGKLAESLAIVGNQMDSAYRLKKKIRGAMIYPSVVLSVMVIVAALMLIYVVPSVTATFQSLNVELPAMTKGLIFVSDFLKSNILWVIVAGAGIFGLSTALAQSRSGKKTIDTFVLALPVIGELVRETNAARMTRTISSLLASGVPYAEAISITADVVQNSKFKKILKEAQSRVEKGDPMSSVFLAHTDLAPVFVGEMMAVGEETGRLPNMLTEVALFYENSVDQKTKDMSTIIEPILMVVIGVAVGFFALAMIKPIYSIVDTL